jgi:hypothetical protein
MRRSARASVGIVGETGARVAEEKEGRRKSPGKPIVAVLKVHPTTSQKRVFNCVLAKSAGLATGRVKGATMIHHITKFGSMHLRHTYSVLDPERQFGFNASDGAIVHVRRIAGVVCGPLVRPYGR